MTDFSPEEAEMIASLFEGGMEEYLDLLKTIGDAGHWEKNVFIFNEPVTVNCIDDDGASSHEVHKIDCTSMMMFDGGVTLQVMRDIAIGAFIDQNNVSVPASDEDMHRIASLPSIAELAFEEFIDPDADVPPVS